MTQSDTTSRAGINLKRALIATTAIALLPLTALAQDTSEPVASERITVTAQKREQDILDVGINVSAISGDQVRTTRVEQVRDLAGYIPNVDIKEQVPGAIPVVTIRGVGLEDFSSTNSPAAGVYVDEVSLSSLALMSFEFYDLERVELLKGPQGTLYGRNSTAGALNIVSAKPDDEFEARATAGYGNYDTWNLEGMINAPLSDTVRLRVSAKTIQQEEGFWTSRLQSDGTPGSRDIGERNIVMGRAQLAIEPNESLDILLKVDAQHSDSEMGQPEHFGTFCAPGFTPIDPANCTDAFLYSDTDGDPFTGDWAGDFPYEIDQLGTTLTVNGDVGFATVTSVTGYIDFERFFHIDTDAGPFNQFDFFQADKVKQLSEELRFAGELDSVDWLVGMFLSWDKSQVRTPGLHDDLIPFETSFITADQRTKSYAIFANGDWHLSEALTLITGLRYTWEERDYRGGTDWGFDIPFLLGDTFIDETISDRNWSWKVGLNWSVDEDSLLYASATQGTKSGGFFSGVTTTNSQLVPYLPETLTAYEVGAKRQQGALLFTGSVFYYDYEDVQTLMRDGVAPVQRIGNVSEAELYGADLDVSISPAEGLTLQAGVGLLETELGSFIGPSGLPIPKGNEMANSPSLTFNALARYEASVGDGLVLALQADLHYSDETFKEATNDPLIAADAYTVVNARVSLFQEAGEWEVALWGKNLGDEQYVVQGLDVGAFGFGNRNYNAPRTYGIELTHRFYTD